MNIPSFSVSRPVLVNLIAISSIIAGLMTMSQMTRESLPAVPTGWATVTTLYSGASPEEVEQLVTSPIEDAVWNVADIREMWGWSGEGRSSIFIQFDPSVKDVGRKVLDISREVDAVGDLPSSAEKPMVQEHHVRFPTLMVAIRGNVAEETLRDLAKSMADHIEEIEGVAEVDRFGVRDRELVVEVDPGRLEAFRVPLLAVAESLRIRGGNLPAGLLESDTNADLVRSLVRAADAESLQNVAIRGGGDDIVRIGDVAEVRAGFEDANIVGKVNGEPAVVLFVNKDDIADSIDISAEVRQFLADANKPAGVEVDVFGDMAPEVDRSLGTLYSNAAVGLIFVLALLWFFVGARNATMAALGLPVALAGALIAMHAMGITINILSLLALILCLGIVVDDAIIIIENIYRHMEEGKSRRQAAIIGAQEVFWPVISSTLTTCAAFLPLLLMTGVLGKFFAIIPKVVVASLVASLIEAFFILPSHMAEFGKLTAEQEQKPNAWRQKIYATHRRWLESSLKHRWLVVFTSYVLCFALVGLAFASKEVVLFTDGDVDMFDVRVTMPADSSAKQTDAVLAEIEKRLLALTNDDVEAILAVRGYARNNMGAVSGDHVGMVTAHLVPADKRSSETAGKTLLAKATEANLDVVGPEKLEVIEFRPGPPRGAPVAIRLLGDDLDKMARISEKVQKIVGEHPGTRDISDTFDLGKNEIRVRFDEARATMHGLRVDQLTAWLAQIFGVIPVAKTRVEGEEVDIRVEVDPEFRNSVRKLESLSIMNPLGDRIALGDLAEIEQARGVAAIQHRDKERLITITAQLDEEFVATEVNRELQDSLESLVAINPDIEFRFGGQYEDTATSLNSLFRAFIVAALLIFTILATQFRSFLQPLVVMAAIPLSLIGVVIGFFVSGAPVGLIALIGVVGLAGIVVNDSLVLVDFINQRRKAHTELNSAIIEATLLRLRPIFLTSITTIAGLMPLAFAGNNAPLLAPMATAIAWGLTFSTILTVMIIPCLYKVIADVEGFLGRVFAPLINWATDPGFAKAED